METNRRGFFGLLAGVVGSSIYTVNANEKEAPLTIPVKDAQHQMMLQLHDKQVISTQTLLEHFGIDCKDEVERLRFEAAAEQFANENLKLPKYVTDQYKSSKYTITKYVLPDNVAPAFKRNIRSVDYHIGKYRFYNYVDEGGPFLAKKVSKQIVCTGIYEGNYFLVNYRCKEELAASIVEVVDSLREREAYQGEQPEYIHITIVSSQSFPNEAGYVISVKPLELVEDFSEVM